MYLHELVNLAGGLDEARNETILLRPVGHVVRIEGDAVAAYAGAGIEGHEAVGLGCRSVDHLPGIDPHPLKDKSHLVDKGDVHVPKDVLDHLHGFSRAGITNRNNAFHDTSIESGGNLSTRH